DRESICVSPYYRSTLGVSALSLHDALPISFRSVIDEATNIAPLPEMDQMMSDTGGRGISLRALVQTYAQMEEAWGPKKALSIRRSEEHTSELQSRYERVCRLLLERKNE